MANFGRSKTWTAETLTSSDLNAEFDNIITNVTSGGINSDNIDETDVYGWTGAHTFGVDDTGVDVKMFGASAGAFLLWDESADLLEVRGATAAGAGHLKLTTGELTVVDGDVLGRIDFQAPVESSGTDAIAVGASIWAEADATFAADNNATELVFATGASETATEKMRIDSSGNVGIGTATPDNNLDIEGTGSRSIRINSDTANSGSGDSFIEFARSVDSANVFIGMDQSNSNAFVIDHGASLGANNDFVIDSSGNVGIGTASPGSTLHAQASDASYVGSWDTNTVSILERATSPLLQFMTATTSNSLIQFGDTAAVGSGAIEYNHNVDDMFFTTAGAEAMRIDSSGNVGIGTSAPASALDINGGTLTLDADADTSISAATDDKITFTTRSINTVALQYAAADNYPTLTLNSGDFGDGNAGAGLVVGRNSNAFNPGAANILLYDKSNQAYFLWVDDSGVLRINTSAPTTANDTAGTVVGTQT